MIYHEVLGGMMRLNRNIVISAVSLMAAFSTALAAEKLVDPNAHSTVQKQRSYEADKIAVVPRYIPPMRGAPVGARLESGGARGGSVGRVGLIALAPDHVGLTINDQPTLYWYLPEPVRSRLELTLIAEKAVFP
jgi:hypothetical protein